MLLIPYKRDFLITFRVKGFFFAKTNSDNTRLIRELVRSPLLELYIVAKRQNSRYACYQLDKLWNTREAGVSLAISAFAEIFSRFVPHMRTPKRRTFMLHTHFPLQRNTFQSIFFKKRSKLHWGWNAQLRKKSRRTFY